MRIIESIPWWHQSKGTGEIPGYWSDPRGPDGGDISCVYWCPNVPGRLWIGSAAGSLYCNAIRSMGCHFRSHVVSRASIVNIEVSKGDNPYLLVVDGEGALTITTVRYPDFQHAIYDSSVHFTLVKSHPFIPGLVYGGTLEGVVCSVDGGLTWTSIYTQTVLGKITAIQFHPANPLEFYVADRIGNTARFLVTTNGGYTFDDILSARIRFMNIHSILFDTATSFLTLGGHGECRVARCIRHQWDQWRVVHQGLPRSEITCMAGPDLNHTIWLGSQGAGIYCLNKDEYQWRRADIEISRRYVQSIAVWSDDIAVGCLESGATVFISGQWSSKNQHIFARSVSRMELLDGSLIVDTDNQLYHFNGRQWRQIPGFPLINDIIAGGQFILVLCNNDSIYSASVKNWYWVKSPFENGHAVRIFGDSTATDFYVIAHDSENHYSIYRVPAKRLVLGSANKQKWSFNNRTPEWIQVADDIPVKEQIFDAKAITWGGTHRLAIATDMGLFFWNERCIGWEEQYFPENEQVHVLAQNNHDRPGLYAGIGSELRYCSNWPDDSHFEVVWRFPSVVSSITIFGDQMKTICVGTDGGELFVSYLNHRFVSVPSSQSLPRINCIAASSSAIAIGTDGVSCKIFRTAQISLQINRFAVNEMAVSVALWNPGSRIEVDLYLMELLDDDSWKAYDVSQSKIAISLAPIPRRMTIESQAEGMEISIGVIHVGTHSMASIMMAGIFLANSDIMIAPFSCIDLHHVM